ncbi:MAG: serine--tRNA ligase, partial [Acidobacteriota bacterium]
MLTPKFILDNFDLVKKSIENRGLSFDLEKFRERTLAEREHLGELEKLRAEKNRISLEVIQKKREGFEVPELISKSREIGERIAVIEQLLLGISREWNRMLLEIPNVPDASVPVGRSSSDNLVVRIFGKAPEFSFEPQAHWDIGTKLGLLDFERAAKIAGSRFAIYMGAGARLERALINFMLDIHTREKGFGEVIPPFIANEASLTGTGNLPKFGADLFKLEGHSWY